MSKQNEQLIHGQPLVSEGEFNNISRYTLLITLAIVPLLLRLVLLDHVNPIISKTFLDTGQKVDFFSYYKFIFLNVAVLILFLAFLYNILKKRYLISKSYINLPIALMFLAILASGILSEYKTTSIFGFFNRHEGSIAYLGYLALFFTAANIRYPVDKAKWFIYVLYPFVIINTLLGLLYLYSINVLHNSFFISLILPTEFPQDQLNASAYISSTLNNPDYISGVGAVLTALFLTRAILAEKMKSIVINIIMAVLSFCMVLASLATNGFFALVVMIPVFICVIVRSVRPKRGAVIAFAALAAFILILIVLNRQNSTVGKHSYGFFLGNRGPVVSDIFLSKAASVNQGNYGDNTKVKEDDEFNLPPYKWAPGSGRWYLWQKTLPLIKTHPLFGYGMDTFPYYFPQDDPEKASGLNDPDTVVDKPHNWYLAIAFGAGLPAVLAFLALVFYHIRQHIKLLRFSKITSERQILLTCLFTALCTYLLQALFNDSTIGPAVIFWILFGVSISLMRQEIDLITLKQPVIK